MKLFRMATLTWAVVAAACGAGTGGALVDIEVVVATEPQEGQPIGTFETKTGFRVVLTEAKLSVASLLSYAPQGSSMSLSRLWLGTAYAHGGFDPFNGRRVRAEFSESEPTLVDLLASEPRMLGVVQAETGTISSSTVVFADSLEGREAQAWIRGTASRNDETIEFEGALALDDQALLRRVDGIPVEAEIVRGGKLTFVIKPHVWLEEAHFDRLMPLQGKPRQITPATQVHTAWSFGARSTTAYATEWTKP